MHAPVTLVEDTPVAGVRVLMLNRPAVRNAIDTALAVRLLHALRRADADATVAAVLILGAGADFGVGADPAEFASPGADPEGEARRAGLLIELHRVFEQIAVPTIAAVQGAAHGAGGCLAVAADLTVLADDATLAWPRGDRTPWAATIPLLQRRVGRKRAFEWLAFGTSIDARAAQAAGLANAVVPADALVDHALRLGGGLAAGDRSASRELKRRFEAYADGTAGGRDVPPLRG